MHILTFDIEDWFHILDNDSTRSPAQWGGFESRLASGVERLLDVLAAHRCRATFFCLGWVARTYPSVVRKIASAGYEIGSHSDEHQLVYELTPQRFADDLRVSIDSIEQAVGRKVEYYRAPGFSITQATPWAFEALARNGIRLDSSVFPAGRAHGGYATFGQARPTIVETNGVSIREFPINTARVLGRSAVFSGGGYFRLAPWWLLRKLTRDSEYVMTYFHPRDFDAGQPVLEGLSAVRRFKSYHGIRGAKAKLDRLLDEFEFVDIAAAEARVDWASAPVITVIPVPA